uniref:chemotaxis protein CheW n=1 Tax=Ningiella ruwaisensis TaxID=2364274 RepID=UPI00109FF84A|nr:chemotaxis protein CheW [Ningiella ruwaisensis]
MSHSTAFDRSSKSPAKQALDDYFQALTQSNELTEIQTDQMPCTESEELAIASRLLAQADAVLLEESARTENHYKEKTQTVETVSRDAEPEPLLLKDRLPKRFQALYFEAAGLTLAIPLTELGGIIKMQALSQLPGKASWLLGVLLKDQSKYQCVNTAKWVMPEKYGPALEASINYEYAVQLGKTPWALACEVLESTHEINQDEVKWRKPDTKRPWLAGMIKEKMCALIDAEALVRQLESKQNTKS